MVFQSVFTSNNLILSECWLMLKAPQSIHHCSTMVAGWMVLLTNLPVSSSVLWTSTLTEAAQGGVVMRVASSVQCNDD